MDIIMTHHTKVLLKSQTIHRNKAVSCGNAHHVFLTTAKWPTQRNMFLQAGNSKHTNSAACDVRITGSSGRMIGRSASSSQLPRPRQNSSWFPALSFVVAVPGCVPYTGAGLRRSWRRSPSRARFPQTVCQAFVVAWQ